MSGPPPLALAGLWLAVITTAGNQCQCTGACGKSHAKDSGRCGREHGGYQQHHGCGTVRLLAAPAEPADLLLPPHHAAALPKQALAAWCPTCHDAALRLARKAAQAAAPAAPDALFDI
ncbi:hypothetical protein ACFV4P_16860 [Kitasatospora sp. NPDC059795]|uniref:hypothetical protein n=1 Tax=Kitasatospora sp. NPDC059795 TaxID=3346949 RepID=UPI003657D140